MKKLVKTILLLSMLLLLASCSSHTAPSFQVGVITLNNQNTSQYSDAEKIMMYYPENFNAKKIAKNILSKGGFKYYDNLNSALLSLDRKDVDSIVLPEYCTNYIVNNSDNKYISTRTKAQVVLSMAAYPSHQALLVQCGQAFIQLNKEKKLDELIQKYITPKQINFTQLNQTLPHYEGKETIKVVLTGDLPPIDYVNSKNEAEGFSIALLTELANKLEINFQVVIGDASQRQSLIKSGKADIAFWMCGVTIDNMQNIDYSSDVPKEMIVSIPYLQCNYSLLSLKQ